MRFLHISIQFPIRMLMPSRRQEVSLSLRNYHRKIAFLSFETTACKIMCQHTTRIALSSIKLTWCCLCAPFSHPVQTSGGRCVDSYISAGLHAERLRHQDVEASCTLIAQGKWRHLWGQHLARAKGAKVNERTESHNCTPALCQGESAICAQMRHSGQCLQGLQDSV